ncbi:MAG TPA: hypothetical protein DGG94_19340 [Micromonosporaceae bacterium]|nr:hypothetical protein [Micromonosporaceae bacterium]
MTEPDVLAVRQLASEPTDESVTRAWYRITQLEAVARPSVSRRRFLIPVAAAGLVVAAGGATALLQPGRRFTPSASPDVVDALNTLAAAAATGTATPIPPGQLIHLEGDGWASVSRGADMNTLRIERQVANLWLDPQGLIVVRDGDGSVPTLPTVEEQRDWLRDKGPGLLQPTPQWLAGLPTDPGKLLKLLRREVGTHKSWSVDHQLWDAMANLYFSGEIALTPQTRAALLRSFAGMNGLSVRDTVFNGQRLVAIRHTENETVEEILFDPVTGRAVGRASGWLGPEVTIIQATAGPTLDPNISYMTTWTQSIVGPL